MLKKIFTIVFLSLTLSNFSHAGLSTVAVVPQWQLLGGVFALAPAPLTLTNIQSTLLTNAPNITQLNIYLLALFQTTWVHNNSPVALTQQIEIYLPFANNSISLNTLRYTQYATILDLIRYFRSIGLNELADRLTSRFQPSMLRPDESQNLQQLLLSEGGDSSFNDAHYSIQLIQNYYAFHGDIQNAQNLEALHDLIYDYSSFLQSNSPVASGLEADLVDAFTAYGFVTIAANIQQHINASFAIDASNIANLLLDLFQNQSPPPEHFNLLESSAPSSSSSSAALPTTTAASCAGGGGGGSGSSTNTQSNSEEARKTPSGGPSTPTDGSGFRTPTPEEQAQNTPPNLLQEIYNIVHLFYHNHAIVFSDSQYQSWVHLISNLPNSEHPHQGNMLFALQALIPALQSLGLGHSIDNLINQIKLAITRERMNQELLAELFGENNPNTQTQTQSNSHSHSHSHLDPLPWFQGYGDDD